MKATFVKDIDLPEPVHMVSTIAGQKLWKLDTPYDYGTNEWDEDSKPQFTEYVVTSAASVMYTGPETYIFPADANGEVVNWGELPGSYKGGLDHEVAIRGFEEEWDE